MPKPIQSKGHQKQHPLTGDQPASTIEIIEDLVDSVSHGEGELAAAAKMLFYMLASGLTLDDCSKFDSELARLAVRHELPFDELLLRVRKDRIRLDEVIGSALSLARRLKIRRIGKIELGVAVTPDSNAGLPAPILQPRQTPAVDLPDALRNRETRLRRIAEILSTGSPDSQDGYAPQPHANEHEQGLVPPPRLEWVSPFSDVLLILSFVTFLVAPLIAFLISWQGNSALNENRRLAPAPDFAADAVVSWPAKVEAYYDDRFGFRTYLVKLYNTILHKYLNASNGDVVIGKDRWLFYAREGQFTDFFGKALFSQDELQRWKEYLENRRTLLARKNSRYLLVIAPDKNTIYPEMLPDYIQQHRGRARLQQLKEYLRSAGSPVDILDLHDALIAAKAQGVVYFPQDTHWNGRGFFVAYQAICAALTRWFPDITPQALGRDYAIQPQAWPGGEWSLFGLTEENLKYRSEFLVPLGTQKARKGVPPFPSAKELPFPDTWNAPLYWEGKARGSLLVFHDSYMRAGAVDRDQVPLAEHFARTMLVGGRYPESQAQLIVDAFHPDVVVEEIAERFLRTVPSREGPLVASTAPTQVPVSPNLDLSTCSQKESIVGPRPTTILEPVNATLKQDSSGVRIIASSNDPYLMLPKLSHPIDGISVKITTQAPGVFEVYAISNNDGGAWAAHAITADLHKGLNQFLLKMPKTEIERLRIDPGNEKLEYVLHSVQYLSGCK